MATKSTKKGTMPASQGLHALLVHYFLAFFCFSWPFASADGSVHCDRVHRRPGSTDNAERSHCEQELPPLVLGGRAAQFLQVTVVEQVYSEGTQHQLVNWQSGPINSG